MTSTSSSKLLLVTVPVPLFYFTAISILSATLLYSSSLKFCLCDKKNKIKLFEIANFSIKLKSQILTSYALSDLFILHICGIAIHSYIKRSQLAWLNVFQKVYYCPFFLRPISCLSLHWLFSLNIKWFLSRLVPLVFQLECWKKLWRCTFWFAPNLKMSETSSVYALEMELKIKNYFPETPLTFPLQLYSHKQGYITVSKEIISSQPSIKGQLLSDWISNYFSV